MRSNPRQPRGRARGPISPAPTRREYVSSGTSREITATERHVNPAGETAKKETELINATRSNLAKPGRDQATTPSRTPKEKQTAIAA
eukprot:scaffold13618_cov66-Phaeocystis_antarctica.AAC.3